MEKENLLKMAREEYDAAMNLATLVIYGDISLSIGEMLESYAILKNWIIQFEEKKAECEKEEDKETGEGYAGLKEMFLSFTDRYEEDIFFDFEIHILDYFKTKKIYGYTPEELTTAKIFVEAAEKIQDLAIKNWKQFLPKE